MRAKFYIALGALLITLSFSSYASLPSTTPSAASAKASKLASINDSQIQKTDPNTSLTSTDPQFLDNQKITELNQSLIQKLRNAVEKNIGLDSSSGPSGGRLACAWANSKIRNDFLRDVASDPNFGPEFAKRLDIGWSNGVNDTASRLAKNPYWIEVPFDQAPDGAIVLSNGAWSGRQHGHIGNEFNGRVVSNSSGRARVESNYSNQSWLNSFKYAKAYIPIVAKPTSLPSSM